MIYIGKFKDLTGQRFGKLTVLKKIDKGKSNKVWWLCQCDCGNTHEVITYHLTHNLCQSCGCLRKDILYRNNIVAKKKRKCNIYNLSGEYGIGYTSKGEDFFFDLEDYDKVKDYTWRISSNGYVVAKDIFNSPKEIKLHRLVMGITEQNIFVDHIYHNKVDNRKSQLRLVTPQQNAANNVFRKNNTSGHKGVYWHNLAQKWLALIQYDKQLINLGLYENIEDAINARHEAELKYFGEYRYRENPNPINT